MKKSYLLLLFLVFGQKIKAQENTTTNTTDNPVKIGKSIFGNEVKRDFSRKGDFFVHWGYNHSWYDNSNINFKGPGYDFTLKNVVARDRQSPLSLEYLNPGQITTPQYNIRAGYFIADNYSVSIGWDHMKYVVDIPQKVAITGVIGDEISTPGVPTGAYAGTYNGQMIDVKSDMLVYEHTDGFNYANIEIARYDDIWVARSRQTSLTLETGIGGGMIVPRTDAHLFGQGRNNHWNVAGYGFSAEAGLKFYVSKHLYFQNTTKVGWTKLKTIHTTGRNDLDKASQEIKFVENLFAIGYQF
ncbi:hypothetical protein [Pedobacter cryoconitis]|uniref:Outermembrane protein n=1 Tax=Pedobacter cryoconitis TaxID=188932 RepID=A0A7X0J5C2_9SPHI|nr:hypothetical protein [Pedobacter cryoconitis]MBB6501370.1 hypothetical protein [Pedobacter cryoconitis]